MLRVCVSIILLLSLVCAKDDNNNNNKYNYPVSGTQLDTELKNRIVNSFNYQRSSVQPTPGDMRYVSWSTVLETMAMYGASQCEQRMAGGKECTRAYGAVLGFAPYVTSPDDSTYEQLVQGWFDSTYYMYECNQCYADEPQMCEQYTQVTHSNVTAVGCASNLCYMEDNNNNNNNDNNNNNNNNNDNNAQIGTTLVCFMTPGYSFEGEDNNDNNNDNNNNNNNNNNYDVVIPYPYTQGDSCSKCSSESPFCINGLCATWNDVFGASNKLSGSLLLILSVVFLLWSIL